MTKGTSFTESGEGVTEKKPEEQKKRIVVNAPGRFSVYNSLAAIAVAEHTGAVERDGAGTAHFAGARQNRNALCITAFYCIG